jgi:hypothetical protein
MQPRTAVEFVEYAMPLVGQLPQTEYLAGYPRA